MKLTRSILGKNRYCFSSIGKNYAIESSISIPTTSAIIIRHISSISKNHRTYSFIR